MGDTQDNRGQEAQVRTAGERRQAAQVAPEPEGPGLRGDAGVPERPGVLRRVARGRLLGLRFPPEEEEGLHPGRADRWLGEDHRLDRVGGSHGLRRCRCHPVESVRSFSLGDGELSEISDAFNSDEGTRPPRSATAVSWSAREV